MIFSGKTPIQASNGQYYDLGIGQNNLFDPRGRIFGSLNYSASGIANTSFSAVNTFTSGLNGSIASGTINIFTGVLPPPATGFVYVGNLFSYPGSGALAYVTTDLLNRYQPPGF